MEDVGRIKGPPPRIPTHPPPPVSRRLKSCLRPPGSPCKKKKISWNESVSVIEADKKIHHKKLDLFSSPVQIPPKPQSPAFLKKINSIPKTKKELEQEKKAGVHLQGWLEKLVIKDATWVTCWVVFKDHTISYYKENDVKALGALNLTESSKVARGRQFHIDGGKYGKPAFRVSVEGVEHVFGGSSVDVTNKWLRVIEAVIALSKKPSLTELRRAPDLPGAPPRPRSRAPTLSGSQDGKVQENVPTRRRAYSKQWSIPSRRAKSRSIGAIANLFDIEMPSSSPKLMMDAVEKKLSQHKGFDLVEKATAQTQNRRRGNVSVVTRSSQGDIAPGSPVHSASCSASSSVVIVRKRSSSKPRSRSTSMLNGAAAAFAENGLPVEALSVPTMPPPPSRPKLMVSSSSDSSVPIPPLRPVKPPPSLPHTTALSTLAPAPLKLTMSVPNMGAHTYAPSPLSELLPTSPPTTTSVTPSPAATLANHTQQRKAPPEVPSRPPRHLPSIPFPSSATPHHPSPSIPIAIPPPSKPIAPPPPLTAARSLPSVPPRQPPPLPMARSPRSQSRVADLAGSTTTTTSGGARPSRPFRPLPPVNQAILNAVSNTAAMLNLPRGEDADGTSPFKRLSVTPVFRATHRS